MCQLELYVYLRSHGQGTQSIGYAAATFEHVPSSPLVTVTVQYPFFFPQRGSVLPTHDGATTKTTKMPPPVTVLRRWARRRVEQVASRVGALFVVTGYALILGVAYVHFTSLVPRVALGRAERAAHYYVSAFLLAELLLQFSLAVWSNPGFVEVGTHAMGTKCTLDHFNQDHEELPLCAKCARAKPPRAHHCRVCRRCVFEMDHHCPWVNNCVGYRNYRASTRSLCTVYPMQPTTLLAD